ncbi:MULTISPECIES: hypothetical protein [unclassified Sphingobacterium]|nr:MULTISPECIES: hypothetical protein [unclassified Sphingobacterium]MCS3554736.1 hypothetical protein [Sphingobacterium sp. JUb21]
MKPYFEKAGNIQSLFGTASPLFWNTSTVSLPCLYLAYTAFVEAM